MMARSDLNVVWDEGRPPWP